MGFKIKSKLMDFSNPEYGGAYEGLEVYVRPVSIGRLRELLTMVDAIPDEFNPMDIDTIMGPILATMVKGVRAWNLEDENGEPLAVSVESIMDQGLEFSGHFIGAYMDTLGGVSAPLGSNSASGETLVEELTLPMEALSESRAS